MASPINHGPNGPFSSQEDLESLFLQGELFSVETEPEWEARLEALEAESPFLHAFAQDQAIFIEPEAEFVEEEEQVDTDNFLVEEVESYDEQVLPDLEDNPERAYDEAEYMEGETDGGKPIARMKFEFQTRNRIWRNDGKTSSLLRRKYGPDDFLVNQDKEGVRLESETDGVLEFETEWFRTWPKLKKAIEKAVEMTEEMNKAGTSKFEKTRKGFPFHVDHLRRGLAKEKAQGYWDPRKGKENDKQKILGAQEELEVEIIHDKGDKWEAAIQSSESFLLEYYESFLRQHEKPHLRDDTIKHTKAILDAANTDGIPASELVKLGSFLQIIVNYTMRGQRVNVKRKPSKFAFRLMNRTNFASIYRWLLTEKEKKLFQKIVKADAILQEMGLDQQSPVFKNGYGTEGHQPGPTVHKWLSGILNGVDLLSAEQSGKGLSASMGKYPVETSGSEKDRWLVKFEARGTEMGRVREAKDWVKYASELFDLASNRECDALKFAQQQGITDENKLANFIFHARHPELKYRSIRRGERDLAQEWLQIRSDLVRPLFPGLQPELETLDGFDHEMEASYEDPDPEVTEATWHPDYETEDAELAEMGAEMEEHEFRLDRWPGQARQHFMKGSVAWPAAVAEGIRAGIRNSNELADLIFFMLHPERMSVGVGQLISQKEPDFVKLRAEWELCYTIAKRRLTPTTACSVFLPAFRSGNYEEYVAPPSTGRITLMLNGRNSGGSGAVDDRTEAFKSMQETVESLGRGDSLFLAAWQLKPTALELVGHNPAGLKNWGELLVSKAKEGVRIRIIVSDMPPDAVGFKSNVGDLKALVDKLPSHARENLKYIVSMHSAKLPDPRKFFLDSVNIGTHHQKLMVVKKGASTIAYCGGLDLSPPRTPKGWPGFLVWHDIHSKLEGLITRDLEHEFILRWNREKDRSTEPRHPGWKTLESLTQAPLSASDKAAHKNIHKLQMHRTVSVGPLPQDIRRDDIWRSYFRLIGCATRFLFLENQYFFEPKLADAIVMQTQSQPGLIIMIVVSFETDDPTNEYTQHGRALQNEFFTRLFAGIPPARRRVYSMHGRLVHSKLVLVDDQFLSIGSANANPRGFFLDTELNVTLNHPDTVKRFRHELWAHDLGLVPGKAETWGASDFLAQWDAVANFNLDKKLKSTPDKMVGESVIPFDPTTVKGKRSGRIPDILSER
jgi:phosphatidylserine/phosphatidylglycerophosphate/cardiolipin synthase-like enzyme